MTSRNRAGVSGMVRIPFLYATGALIALVVLGASSRIWAQEAASVSRLDSPAGTLLQRTGTDKDWKAVAKGAAVPDRDLLLALPGIHAAIKSANGTVRLTLLGNLPQESPTPALESAVTLRQSADFDLDAILDRGRILIANTKEKGAASIRVRARDEIWEIALKESGTEVSLELNGRWLAGMPYRAEFKSGEEPEAELVLLVLKGTIDLKVDAQRHTLRAPPGPALFAWHSVGGPDRTARPLPEVPPWARPGADKTPPVAAVRNAAKPLILSLSEKPAGAALADVLASADKIQDKEGAALVRELAVTGFGAIDDLGRLMDALGSTKHADERAFAVETLRHWIGRRAGQDALLGRFLIRQLKYTPEHATTLLQLLHSYGRNSIEDPVTYELLIAYLQHDRLPIRELAAWHLYRLAPAGRDIKYNPAGSKEELEQVVKEWKKIIPPGQLPLAPKGK